MTKAVAILTPSQSQCLDWVVRDIESGSKVFGKGHGTPEDYVGTLFEWRDEENKKTWSWEMPADVISEIHRRMAL